MVLERIVCVADLALTLGTDVAVPFRRPLSARVRRCDLPVERRVDGRRDARPRFAAPVAG